MVVPQRGLENSQFVVVIVIVIVIAVAAPVTSHEYPNHESRMGQVTSSGGLIF